MQAGAFTFGPFTLDAGAGTLLRENAPVAISHRGVLLLAALTAKPGKVFSKGELIDAAWPGMTVEEGNLTVQIAALRKLLGAAPDGSVWIATVQRVGYRFMAEAVKPEAAVPRPRTAAPAKPSLAVLPFDNMSGDPEQDYFADGIVEDVLTALSRFRSFAVVARNSSFAYRGRAVDVREVARDLGVRYVLEGSVRRAGPRLRITAQLIDAATGSHIWADRHDGATEEVFDVQDRITTAVATAIEPEIREVEIETSRRERPGSLAAYDLYLHALPLHRDGTPASNAEAFALLSQAVALEPQNATFLAWMLDVLLHRTIMAWPPFTSDDRGLVRDLVQRALKGAGNDSAVLGRCGNALVQVLRDKELGLATLERAVRANPNSIEAKKYAGIGQMHLGDPEEARRLFEAALALGPRDLHAYVPLTGIAHVEMIQGRWDAAREAAQRSLGINAGFDPTFWMLIAANAQMGRDEEAGRWLARYREASPRATLASIAAAQPPDPTRMGAILEGLRRAGLPEK